MTALGLAATAHADDTAQPLPAVSVNATREAKPAPSADTEDRGFRPASAEIGPMGKKKLQDVPASVNVLNHQMLDDRQVTSLNDALKYLPSTQMEARGGVDVGRPQSRGMEGSVVDNSHVDGMNVVATTALPIEMYDRIEVLNSLTGAPPITRTC